MKKRFTKTTVILLVLLVIFAFVSVYALAQMHNWKSMYQELLDELENMGIEIELPDKNDDDDKKPVTGTEGLKFILSGDKQSYYCAGFGLVPDGPAYVVVPAEYDGKVVTGIATDAFTLEPRLSEIVLPDTITFIGKEAFDSVKNLTSITIPDSVVEIRDSAFVFCDNLECVYIGDGVTEIGSGVFSYCDSLTSVYIATDGWVDYRGNAVDFSDPKAAAELLKRGGSYTRITEDNQ